MNNIYFYKAKRLDNGEWVEGALFDGEKYCVIGQQIKFSPYIENECKIVGYMVDPSTICKCTELKDKNGKLIWENDVVKYQDTIGIVNWNKTHLAYTILKKNKDGNMQYYYMDEELGENIEVIGNTFDNPEMLEVEE